jgi:hypothetical protein
VSEAVLGLVNQQQLVQVGVEAEVKDAFTFRVGAMVSCHLPYYTADDRDRCDGPVNAVTPRELPEIRGDSATARAFDLRKREQG